MSNTRYVPTGPILLCIGIILMIGGLIFDVSTRAPVLGTPSAPIHHFDAQDYYNADQWCKAHGYTTTQDVVHGVTVGASCLDPNDRMGNHIPAPYAMPASVPVSSASGSSK